MICGLADCMSEAGARSRGATRGNPFCPYVTGGKLPSPPLAPDASPTSSCKDGGATYCCNKGGGSDLPPPNRPTSEETSGTRPNPLPKTLDATLPIVPATLLPLVCAVEP